VSPVRGIAATAGAGHGADPPGAVSHLYAAAIDFLKELIRRNSIDH
jgi:hypothetical protein